MNGGHHCSAAVVERVLVRDGAELGVDALEGASQCLARVPSKAFLGKNVREKVVLAVLRRLRSAVSVIDSV